MNDDASHTIEAEHLWREGRWPELSRIECPVDLTHPSVAMKCAGLLQIGQFKQAKKLLSQALDAGASKRMFASAFISCAEESLARIAAVQDDLSTARMHLLEALRATGLPASEVDQAAQKRLVQTLTQLGLLQEAGALLKEDISSLRTRDKSVELDKRIEVLESEIGTLEAALLSVSAAAVGGEKSYSQLGQDRWVLEQSGHKRQGYFVEFGATDGVLLSNTYLLEREFDWQGLVAEPNPVYFEKLKNNRHCTVSDACIGPVSGETVQFVLAKEYGGIADFIGQDKHLARRRAYADLGKTLSVTTVSLDDFLKAHGAPKRIDYLSIDTEGSEYVILKDFPFDEWEIGLITIEHNNGPTQQPLRNLLCAQGYVVEQVKWDDWYSLPNSTAT
ncbi:MAG: FkbM family methyltransferase [Pseudomonadota bacterium]|nr:FkbM family methyltransferase [Pseudomonadota bacterium]